MTHRWLAGAAMIVAVAFSVSGCVPDCMDCFDRQEQPPMPTPETSFTAHRVTGANTATGATVTGWPYETFPIRFAVSDLVYQYCPFDESTLLDAEQIAADIPVETLQNLEGFSCARFFNDELAFRVDGGLGPLLEAYARTTSEESSTCQSNEISDSYPRISVEFESENFTIEPGLYACALVADAVESAVNELVVTEIVRHTITDEDYLLSGY